MNYITQLLTCKEVSVASFSEACEPGFDFTEVLLALDLTEERLKLLGVPV